MKSTNKRSWTSAGLSALIAGLVVIFTNCSATAQRDSVKWDSSKENDNLTQPGIDEFYEGVSNHVLERVNLMIRTLGLRQLEKETDKTKEFEFRIWTDLEARSDPKVLGFRHNDFENTEYFFEIRRNTLTIKTPKPSLGPPRSGWDQMLSQIRDKLSKPAELERDSVFKLNRDEPLMLLEVLDNGNYRRVLYGQHSVSQDAMRLIEICAYLGTEFDVDLNCRGR